MIGTDGTSDFLITGGGVIGRAMASEAKRRYPDSSVTLIEKEERCGMHASGRNSGVLAQRLGPIAGYAKMLADFDVRLEFDVMCSDAWRRLAAEHPVPCAT